MRLGKSGKPKVTRPKRSGVKLPRWNDDEEARLRTAVDELGEKAWAQCAERIRAENGHLRSAASVEQHWQILTGKRKRDGKRSEALALRASPAASSGGAATVNAVPAGGAARPAAAVGTPRQAGAGEVPPVEPLTQPPVGSVPPVTPLVPDPVPLMDHSLAAPLSSALGALSALGPLANLASLVP